jgi:hypothetical protein
MPHEQVGVGFVTCVDCSSLKSQVQALLDENAAVLERYEITERGRYAAEREVRRLKAQLNGSTTPESAKVKLVCDYHDELWRSAFPKARGLSYPMDGKNAATVRKVIRWGFTVEQIKQALDGAFASEFHRSKPQYLYLASILGDENKIRNHLTRLEPEAAEKKMQGTVRRLSRELPSWEDPVETLLTALTRDGWEWRVSGRDGWTAQCPAHHGTHFNLSVDWNTPGDRLLLKCWSRDCSAAEVMAALDLPIAALFRRSAA